MSITSQAQYIAAAKREVRLAATTSQFNNYSGSSNATDPGAATSGVVPAAGNQGYPALPLCPVGINSYLTKLTMRTQLISFPWAFLADCVFKAGAFGPGANVTLASQPDYSSRLPGGDYKSTELWVEAITAWPVKLQVQITYLNENGVQHQTPVVAVGTPVAAGAMQIPLAAGDFGVSKIISVVESGGGSSGTFNVLVLHPLATATLETQTARMASRVLDYMLLGMPVVPKDAALHVMSKSATSGRTNFFTVELAWG